MRRRLAFLGDAVLQICATEWLYTKFPTSRIGNLTVSSSFLPPPWLRFDGLIRPGVLK